MTWRQLTIDDAAAVARALAAAEAVDGTGEHYSEADVRDVLSDESNQTIAAFAPDGEVVAFASVHGSGGRFDTDGAVVPAARRRGLGRRLLEWAEERVAAPAALWIDVHENNPGKEALVRAAGYEATRWQYRMTHTLDPLPDVPTTPPGLTLTPYDAARSEAVRLAHCEAFADTPGATPPDESTWARWFTAAQTFRPDVTWLVLDGDEVAAYVLSYFWAADAAATGVREAYLGQLGVRPSWRRRGLGGLLLATALQSYRAAGYERASLGVDVANATGALGLYERAGFVVSGSSVTWTKPLY